MSATLWRQRITANDTRLVDPTAVLSFGRAAVFGIGPTQRVIACREVETLPAPIYFSGNPALLRPVHEKPQQVIIRFGRNLPPERQCYRAAHRGFEPARLAV